MDVLKTKKKKNHSGIPVSDLNPDWFQDAAKH